MTITREQRIDAVREFVAWRNSLPSSLLLTTYEESLEAYDQHLELEELREFKRKHEGEFIAET